MNTNKNILILTANYGNGHVQVAKTLYQECERLGFKNVTVSNLYQESNPIVSEITQYLYLKSFSIGKQFYRLFYYGVDKIYNKRKFNIYFKMGNKRLDQLVKKHQPDIIINTFPMIVVPEYRRRMGKVIPTFNVMTDFCLHKIWVHEHIDKYYVATDYVKENCSKSALTRAMSRSRVFRSAGSLKKKWTKIKSTRSISCLPTRRYC